MDQATFNPIYWAAQHHEVQALQSLGETPERMTRAVELAVKGFLIDTQIHAEGLDPFGEMEDRIAYGYVEPSTGRGWVPNLLQGDIPQAPGLHDPGLPVYDPSNPPAGSILVSLDPKDFPPIDPIPPAPPPPGHTSLVGKALGATWNGRPMYIALGTPGPDGFQYTDPNGAGVFTFHRIQNLPGSFTRFFTLNG